MGRTFRLFVDAAAADAEAVQRLRHHLRLLERKGTVIVFRPDDAPPGAARAATLRRELLDADVTLFLLSPDLLSDDESYDRLRQAAQRGREGPAPLRAVLVRPCAVDPEDVAAHLLIPSPRPLASPTDDEGWQAVVHALRGLFDVLERNPFGARPTRRSIVTQTLRLDRLAQWAEVQAGCAGPDHCFFVLYGRRGQAVTLFAERVCHLLEMSQSVPHIVLHLPVRSKVATAVDIENKLRGVLAGELGGEAGDTGQMLYRLTRRARVFLVLAGVHDQGWPARERAALAEFVTQRLPRLLPADGQRVQLLLMFEYDQPQASLKGWIDSWARSLSGPLRYRPLPEAHLPPWDEVLGLLQARGADPEIIADIQAFYDKLTRDEAPDFQRLGAVLEEYV